MTIKTIPLSEAKARLTRLLRDVEELGEPIVITRSGRPTAMLISAEEYDGLLETLEILVDPVMAAAVEEGLRAVEAGDLLSDEEVWRDLDPSL